MNMENQLFQKKNNNCTTSIIDQKSNNRMIGQLYYVASLVKNVSIYISNTKL